MIVLYVVAVTLERIWVKKPGEENDIKSDVEMSRVSGFATHWFRSKEDEKGPPR